MCRSSRILRFLSLGLLPALVLAPTFAEAGGLSVRGGVSFGAGPFAARPFSGAPRAAVRTGVDAAVRPGIRPGIVGVARTPGRFGPFGKFGRRGFGYGGFDAAGLGLSIAGDLGAPPALPDEGYGAEPEPSYVPVARPPCVKPLIISVGRGLRHPARTRVVYGAPSSCGS